MKINFQSSSKKVRPDIDQGLKVNYGPARRGGYRVRWFLLLALLTVPLVIVGWLIAKPFLLVTADGVITTDPLEIRSPMAGQVLRVDGVRGMRVKAGTPIIQLKDGELTAEIVELEWQLAGLSRDEELAEQLAILEQLERQVAVAREGLSEQEEFRRDYENFRRSGIVPAHDMAIVLQTVTNSRLNLEAARTAVLKTTHEQAQERAAGIVVQRRQALELQLSRLRARQQQSSISLMQDSRIIDLLVKPGEFVQADQPLLLTSSLPEPVIFAYLQPKFFEYAGVGRRASVRLPNGSRIKATVSEPPELTQTLPASLRGPFDGQQPVLKVTLTPEIPLPVNIEGLPVRLTFHYGS